MSETSLTLNEHYAAAPGKVFHAWSDADTLREWFAPSPKMKTIIDTFDFRVGGAFHLNMQEADGKNHIAAGTFLEIIPDRKIVMEWRWLESTGDFPKGDTLLTITLSPADAGTDLTLTHEKLRNAADVKDHTEGWQGMLVRLKQLA
jgi:uncharacterized protein YndB with AHSA1/START domain